MADQEGIRIRLGTARDIPRLAEVAVQSWRTTYQDWAPTSLVNAMTVSVASAMFAQCLDSQTHSYFLYVAEKTGNEIIGFVDGGKDRNHLDQNQGELYSIYILKEHQNQRIGTLLFNAALSRCQQLRMDSMVVWIFSENPYKKFYEKMGGQIQENHKKIQFGKYELEVTAYYWYWKPSTFHFKPVSISS
jgi:L-amino acid N-acyltransferase YncA